MIMKELIEELKRIKEDRLLGSAGAQALERFVGQRFSAKFLFSSSTRTFSLRHDEAFNSGYTVTCRPEGEEIEVTVLFRPTEDDAVQALTAGEVFESEVNFVEFDSLYQRAVFTGSFDLSGSGPVPEELVRAEELPVPESQGTGIGTAVKSEPEPKPEPEPEKTDQESVKVPAERKTSITAQRCTLEIDGHVKEISQELISSFIEELREAKNYWIFKPGSQRSWRSEFISYSRNKLSINEDDPARRDHSYQHWKGGRWKEQSIVSPEEALDKLKEILDADQFENERPSKVLRGLGQEVQVDWGPRVEMSLEGIDEVLESLSEANECWVLIVGSEKLGYKEFIQYLFDDGDGPGTYEKWRGGAPVQREKISPEEALNKAENYLRSDQFVTVSYLSHFSGEFKQKPVRSVSQGRSSKKSAAGDGINGQSCGCFALFAIVATIAMGLFTAEAWAPAIIVILLGALVGRFMTSDRKS